MSTASDPFPTTNDAHEHEVAAHRAARIARLTADDGWLTVIAKEWLSPGSHAVGSGPGCSILLPAGRAPAKLGSITRQGSSVRFVAEPGVELSLAGGDAGRSVELGPEGVTLGDFTLQLVRRGDDVAVRVRDAQAPARRAFAGIPAYPTDGTWRILATLRPHATPRRVILEDGDGRPQDYLSPGVAVFERGGAELALEPVYESDGGRLFVLFADPTNRDATYGAGRFLYAPLPRAGRVLLDFNLAFNPPCAFTPHATCPLPPANNRLALRVEAGEKKPAPY